MAATKYWLNSWQLPINPSSYSLQRASGNQTVEVENLGEVNLIGKRGLAEISFTGIFPAKAYNFLQISSSRLQKPYVYIKRLKNLQENGTVFSLKIEGTDVNLDVTIEDLSYQENDGTGDVEYSLTLKEYRVYAKNNKKLVNSSNIIQSVKLKRAAKKVKSKTVTWKKGDTFQKVAKKYTGTSANASAIKKQNEKQISKLKLAYRKKYPKASKVPVNDLLVGKKVVIKV